MINWILELGDVSSLVIRHHRKGINALTPLQKVCLHGCDFLLK